jgi:Zn-dependent M28 family amino/carboxypeptidase
MVMADAIKLPILFDDGTTKDITVENSDRAGNVYSITVNGHPAGEFVFSEDKNEWSHDGQLSKKEQLQVARFIQNYTDTGWDN